MAPSLWGEFPALCFCADIDGGVREREWENLPSRRCWSVWWRWLLSQQCFRWIVLQSASISDTPQGGETENERRDTERTDGEDLGTQSWFRSFIRHFKTTSCTLQWSLHSLIFTHAFMFVSLVVIQYLLDLIMLSDY